MKKYYHTTIECPHCKKLIGFEFKKGKTKRKLDEIFGKKEKVWRVGEIDKKDNDLSAEYVKLLDSGEFKDMTWDDFFDKHGVPVEARTDMAVASIMNGAIEIINSR